MVRIIGLSVAAACLFVRSCWRAAELDGGFNGPLASMESVFIALDSVPMAAMTIALTILHPRLWPKRRRVGARKSGDAEGYSMSYVQPDNWK